jgi:cell wall-associated NlpC family hydrolase
MTAYRYARPYRRARRYRSPYGRRSSGSTFPVVAIVAAVAIGGATAGAKAVAAPHGHAKAAVKAATGNAVATQVTAFAGARVGKVPYEWGGTTDAGMDCSGLAQAAYASAGVSIERTSQDQWASERHVSQGRVAAGDLVFFAGSDGTDSAPGHVGIVTDPEKDQMIDAFGAGTYVRREGYGPAASPGTGLSAVVGFTDPAPASAVPAAGGEAAFTTAVLSGLGAPGTRANVTSLAAWIRREWPSWPPGAANNALDTTLAMPGSQNFNTFDGDLHVQSYPSAAEGEQATAETLLGGYSGIVAAFRSGAGICGGEYAAELSAWSGNTYQEVC